MAPNTLSDIRTKVRRLTGRPSANQITNAEIDNYVNTFYVYDFPEALKILKLRDTYSFQTEANTEVYQLNTNYYTTVEPPCYCAGQQMNFYEDRDIFYRIWPKVNTIAQVATGNGTAGPYTGTIMTTPFLRSVNATSTNEKNVNIMLSANIPGGSTVALDNGANSFLAPAAGTIDDLTGNFTVTFPAVVPGGTAIMSSVISYSPARPTTIMFAQNQIYLRPIPDQAYNIDVTVYRTVTDLINAGDSPELDEWWQLLAFGAAVKILVDNADYELLEKMRPYYEEQLVLMQRRTIAQLDNQRTSTIYADGTTGPYGNQYPYF